MKKYISLFVLFISITSVNAQWVQVWNGMGQNYTVRSFAYSSNKLFAGCRYDGLYTSTNEGLVWTPTSINSESVMHLLQSGTYIYASSWDNKIYKSIDNGISWPVFASFSYGVNCTLINGTTIYAGLNSLGVFYSTNNGSNWTQSFLNNKSVYSLLYKDNYLLAGTGNNGIYYSTDNGYTWNQSGFNNKTVNTLCLSNQYILAGTDNNGIYRSSDNGLNWNAVGLNNLTIHTIKKNGNYIYAGTGNSGIYVSGDNGNSWSSINDGLPNNTEVYSIVFTDNYAVVGTYSNCAYRRPKSQVDVKNNITKVPNNCCLNQNYPNPFNPKTNIKYEIKSYGFVTLKLFDIQGKELETLVSEKQSPGFYELLFDGTEYSSGLYFYKIQTGNYIQTKKMILIK